MVYMQCRLCVQDDKILYANRNARYMFLSRIDGDELVVEKIIWNIIEINRNKYFIDTFMGSGNVIGNKWKSDYSDYYFIYYHLFM